MKKLLSIIAITLCGCTTAHKAVRYMDKHKVVGVEYCMVRYPCLDSVHESILYKEGRVDTIEGETIILNKDSVIEHVTTKYIKVKCPDRLVRTDTVFLDKVVYQTNKENAVLLQSQIEQTFTANAKVDMWRKRFFMALSALGIIVLLWGIKLAITKRL